MSTILNAAKVTLSSRMRRVRCARSSRSGFTLIELLVAMGLTSVVAVGLYAISMVASQSFQQQQRVSEIQLRVRNAMEMLRADIQRAGYMASPASIVDPQVCPRRAGIQALFAQIAEPNPTHNPTDNLGIAPVRLVLTGNYSSTDEYPVAGINSAIVYLQHQQPAFAYRVRSQADMDRIFKNRVLRLMGSNGQMQFGFVTSTSFSASAGTYPSLSLATAPVVIGQAAGSGSAGCGIAGVGTGATVAPITTVEYAIETAEQLSASHSNAFAGAEAFVAGKTDLVRRELTADTSGEWTPVAGSERIIAEYAVDLDVAAVIAEPNALGQPMLRRLAFGDAQNFVLLGTAGTSGALPQRVRGLRVRLSARERTQDPDFGWTARQPTDALTRFRIFSGQLGAARVRSLTTEIMLPNVASRNLL
jgi:prepilin-type N-terminal cleavage/methylation domain-containing protein